MNFVKKIVCSIFRTTGSHSRDHRTTRANTTRSGDEVVIAHIYAQLPDRSLVRYQGPHITVRLGSMKDYDWTRKELGLAAKMTLIYADTCCRSFEPNPEWDPNGTFLDQAYYQEAANKVEYQVLPLLPFEFQTLAVKGNWMSWDSSMLFHELSVSSNRQIALLVRWAPTRVERGHRPTRRR